LIETEAAGVYLEGDPDQIEARRVSCRLTIVIELSCRGREIGGGAAQAKGVTAEQGRICVPNQTPSRPGGQFGERRPHLSHSGRASEDLESLTQIVTAFIVGGG